MGNIFTAAGIKSIFAGAPSAPVPSPDTAMEPMSDDALVEMNLTIYAEQQARDAVDKATRRPRTPMTAEKLAALHAAAQKKGKPLTQAEIDDVLANAGRVGPLYTRGPVSPLKG